MMKAVITGHTRGLGAAVAATLLAQHIPLLGIARSKNAALAAEYGAALDQVELDLAVSDDLTSWLAAGELDRFLSDCDTVLLINNAATAQPLGTAQAHDIASITRAVALNVAVPLALSCAVIAASARANDRRILHLSSGAGRDAFPGMSIYGATKAALDQHARLVAQDRIPNLRICSLAPGIIDTDMQAEVRASPADIFPLLDMFVSFQRSGNLVAPQTCAKHLVDYLLSEPFGQAPVFTL